MSYWVYIHTCPNGKKYVGCTKQARPEYRWQGGRGYKGQLFGKAILKYGWGNITHEVFDVESEEEMYRKEVELISFYHSNDPKFGYNNSSGGEQGSLGCKHSKEFRRKISETLKKRYSDPEYRKKMYEATKKVHADPEYRKHMSEVMKEKPGKPLSEETKKKLSKAHKGKILSEEHRKHIAESLKGRTFSEESRQRIAENNRRKAKDPEYRKKLSEVAKNRPKVKIKLPDGTVIEITKQLLTRWYVNKGKAFEYVS